jgi:GAF domain-containing protein/anti-sigma regulatory factor (Ser/Thr protein kinase)
MRRPTRSAGKTAKKSRLKSAVAKRSTRTRSATSRDLQARVDALERDLREAREQQTATGEVLKVISSSPGELAAVFESLLASAKHLCGADFGIILLREGDAFRTVALHGPTAEYTEARWHAPFIRPAADTGLGRVLETKQVVQIADVRAVPGYVDNPVQAPIVQLAGVRSKLSVPMLKEDCLIGVIEIDRQEVRPFTEKQIELVQNFAAQAVIAIENTRLLNELRQSLEQQTATADVLKVISRSTFDLQTVLDTLVRSAARLCRAERTTIRIARDGLYHNLADYGFEPGHRERMRTTPLKPNRGSIVGRVVLERRPIHILDAQADPDPEMAARSKSGNVRSILGVPLLREGIPIGVLLLQRSLIEPFTDKQIDLATTFADQAVIAIENVRLFDEVQRRTEDLTESLEQQTATSEVLKVISSSPGELKPVFQAMLENAVRICEAQFGVLFRYSDGAFYPAGSLDVPRAYAEFLRDAAFRPLTDATFAGTPLHRLLHSKDVVRSDDEMTEANPGPAARYGGARSLIAVPLRKDSELVGAFVIYRQRVRPFTDKQIELVQNFAAQAVIAIENTRLLNELRESLQQQTATADVLKVISRSTFDLRTVLNTLVESASRLCDAYDAVILLRDNDSLVFGAHHGPIPMDFERWPITRAWTAGRSVEDRKTIHVHDLAAADDEFPEGQAMALRLGHRTILSIPLLRENEAIGSLSIRRTEVRPFTDKQVELAKTFADQAVIAIENTRLLNELRQRTDDLTESLDQQTATSEVLKVISGSPGDLTPVFETMLAKATTICEASYGTMWLREGDGFRTGAIHGDLPAAFIEQWQREPIYRPGPDVPLSRAIATRGPAQVVDLKETESYRRGDPLPTTGVDVAGIRSLLVIPMLKEGEPIGALAIYRREVRPFTDKHIELLTNFAAQAVIAIENTRLLNELRETLDRQTATSEVLRIISSSPGELRPVFDAMLANAVRVCGSRFGVMYVRDGDKFETVALHGALPAFIQARLGAGLFTPGSGTGLARAIATRDVVHIADIRLDQGTKDDPLRTNAIEAGVRTLLVVPMLKEGEPLGAIAVYRHEVRPFADKQIELVQNFAAQAVIAIENTRLLSELRESLQQQTATADVLKTISRSTFDLQTVLDALLRSAAQLCDADMGTITQKKGDQFYRSVAFGFPDAFLEYVKNMPVIADRTSGTGRALVERKVVHIPDVNADSEFDWPEAKRLGGFRTMLGVPMLREGIPVGVLTLTRADVRPFTDKQIELVATFADQAAIAIENVRLFDEVQTQKRELTETLEHQTATSEVLSVISRSPTNAGPVFDAIAESAARLCEAVFTVVWLYDGDLLHYASSHNFTAEVLDRIKKTFPKRADRSLAAGRAILDGKIAHVPDMLADPAYAHELAMAGNWRASIAVPILRDGRSVGAISVGKAEAGPFTERQMQLLTTFADQAVIAIENVRLFDEIQEKGRQLAEASQHKSQFLANMSHELRTPLNAILGYTELIIDGIYGETPEKAQTVLKRVESNGKHLLGLINDVLDLSKIEAGQLKLSLTDYSMKDVVYSVFSAVEPLATKKKLDFKVDVPPDMPPGYGDGQKLTQVLLNLAGNAIKFTDAGEVVIKAAAVNGAFSVAIHDTGPGISAADQTKLFQQFQQADNSITKTKGGTGLGLAISKRIIEMHGGSISVDSSVGHGSTFTFTLPVKVERQANPP